MPEYGYSTDEDNDWPENGYAQGYAGKVHGWRTTRVGKQNHTVQSRISGWSRTVIDLAGRK